MESKIQQFGRRAFLVVAMLTLLAASAHAQKPVTRYGEEDDPKTPAELELQRKAEAAYKRSLGTVPDVRTVDPWGGVRSEPTKPAPAKKKSAAPN